LCQKRMLKYRYRSTKCSMHDQSKRSIDKNVQVLEIVFK